MEEYFLTFLYTKMKNKSLLIKLGLVELVVWVLGLSSTFATNFSINMEGVGNLVSNNIVPINFVDNGNDFGGFLYFSNGNLAVKEAEDVVEGDEWDEWDEWLDIESLNGEIFKVSIKQCEDRDLDCKKKSEKECKMQLKWLYYNAERWDRLWPLDEQALHNFEKFGNTGWVTMDWWIYTLCRPGWYSKALEACQNQYGVDTSNDETSESDDDLKKCVQWVDEDYPQDNAYYGMVTWQLPEKYGNETFVLLVGVEYDKDSSEAWIPVKKWEDNLPKFTGNFMRLNNLIPLGFVYDYKWWIWFAWCEIKADQQDFQEKNPTKTKNILKTLLGKQGELWDLFDYDYDYFALTGTLSYKGEGGANNVNCSKIWMVGDSLLKFIVEWLVGLDRESDLWLMWNQQDPKMQYFSSSDINTSTLLNYAKQKSEILCRRKWATSYNSTDWENADVVCLSGVDVSAANADNIRQQRQTLIVKSGNVTVNPFVNSNDTYYHDIFIDSWNLIVNEDKNNTSDKFVFTKGWFISDMTVAAFSWVLGALSDFNTYNGAEVAVWSFIRWNFVVNGKVKPSNSNDTKLHNKYFVYGKFSTKDSSKDLEKTFAWRCSNWFVVDNDWVIQNSQWRYCPPSVYQNAALVVIDQNYDSPLYW